jgi:hypothetical protein
MKIWMTKNLLKMALRKGIALRYFAPRHHVLKVFVEIKIKFAGR